MYKAKMGSNVEAMVERNGIYRPKFLAESIWDVEHCRRMRKGVLYYDRIISKTTDHNVCTAEGLNKLLDVMFHGVTAISAWYVLLFNTNTTPSDTTTYATPVFTESEDYDEATRPAYTEAAASTKSITNSANKATFTISGTTTIYGGALVGGGTAATTKSDTAGGGTMYCASKFSSSKAVVDDDIIYVTITITAADA